MAHVNTSSIEAGIGREDDFSAYANRKNVVELPGLKLAMWPGDVHMDMDVSGFNDRYLEPSNVENRMNLALHLAGWTHNMGFLLTFVYFPLSGVSLLSSFGVYVVVLLFSLPLFFLTKKALEGSRVRFNRQAQIVHVMWGKNTLLNIPWQDARFFTRYSSGHFIEVGFPIPKELKKELNQEATHILHREAPFTLMLGFADGDSLSIQDNLKRLEFFRRYMELGLEGIRPAEGVETRNVRLRKLRFKDLLAGTAPIISIFSILFKIMFYWAACGPLIDRWIQKKIDDFKWPEEVERMCAPGADLSGFDTTPVHPSKELFYRISPYGYDLCDKDGNRIDPL